MVMNYFAHNAGICRFCLGWLKVMQPIQKASLKQKQLQIYLSSKLKSKYYPLP